MLRGITEAAHRRGRLAVDHVTERVHARNLIEVGIDGLEHAFVDEVIDPALVQLAVQKGIFMVAPTSRSPRRTSASCTAPGCRSSPAQTR